ncbi:MAG: hypothetical protein ACKVOP_02585 [Sphingomonadaceae bacterium]
MKARFDQVRVDVAQDADDIDIARAAETISAAHRAVLVASAVGTGGSQCNAIVADYGKSLKGAVLGMIRQSILYDAEVLPFDKETIKSALVDCAMQQMWSETECATLGDLHFYLSYFRVGLTEREDEPGDVLLAEQRTEGVALRSEWQSLVASRKQSWFSKFTISWLKH